jgi:predicted ABC-type transport system involved in lysophospholipase L1 biosynthesis ATPase subunit
MELLLSLLGRGGMATVIVTHDQSLIDQCPRRIGLLDGRVAEDVRGKARGRATGRTAGKAA